MLATVRSHTGAERRENLEATHLVSTSKALGTRRPIPSLSGYESPLIFLHGVAEPDEICTTARTDLAVSISLRVRKRSVARG